MMGFSAVQIALARGIKIFTTAGPTYADKLRGFGATVTAYGDGMVERVLAGTRKRGYTVKFTGEMRA